MPRNLYRSVLVIPDASSRKALDVYNLCCHYSIPVLLTSEYSLIQRLLLSLVYLRRIYSVSQFTKKIDCDKNTRFVYLPMEENSTREFIESRLVKRFNVTALLPRQHAFSVVSNKSRFREFCRAHDICAPQIFNSLDEISNSQLRDGFIVKPNNSSGSRGISLFANRKSLLDALNKKTVNFEDFSIEEYIRGGDRVLGGFFLFHRGKLIDFYSHERKVVYPKFGGASIVCDSSVNELVRKSGKELLESLSWNGLAMVEYVFDPIDDALKVIEVNPRVWGSIILSTASQKHFLQHYFNLALDKDIKVERFRAATLIWLHKLLYLWATKKISVPKSITNKNRVYVNITFGTYFIFLRFHFVYVLIHALRVLQKRRKKGLNVNEAPD